MEKGTPLDRLVATECNGSDTSMYALLAGDLLGDEASITSMQAVGIARAVKYVLNNRDRLDVQLAIGSSFMIDLDALIEKE